MHFRILLFGPQSVIVGSDSVDVVLPDPTGGPPTPAVLREVLAESHPGLAASLPASRFAVNHRFAADDESLDADDEIALIGMISGG